MKDLLLNEYGELLIKNNDFVIGESTGQHQRLLLVTQRGEWKENPDVGAGIANFLNDDDIDGMMRETRHQFTKDGQTVDSLNYDEQTGQLDFDADYNS